jgi:hypothetical protein
LTDDIVFRLEYASMSTPELSLLRESAAYITNLRKELEDARSNEIVLVTESGEEIAVIDADLSEWVYKEAVTQFIHTVLRNAIAEHESQQRPD